MSRLGGLGFSTLNTLGPTGSNLIAQAVRNILQNQQFNIGLQESRIQRRKDRKAQEDARKKAEKKAKRRQLTTLGIGIGGGALAGGLLAAAAPAAAAAAPAATAATEAGTAAATGAGAVAGEATAAGAAGGLVDVGAGTLAAPVGEGVTGTVASALPPALETGAAAPTILGGAPGATGAATRITDVIGAGGNLLNQAASNTGAAAASAAPSFGRVAGGALLGGAIGGLGAVPGGQVPAQALAAGSPLFNPQLGVQQQRLGLAQQNIDLQREQNAALQSFRQQGINLRERGLDLTAERNLALQGNADRAFEFDVGREANRRSEFATTDDRLRTNAQAGRDAAAARQQAGQQFTAEQNELGRLQDAQLAGARIGAADSRAAAGRALTVRGQDAAQSRFEQGRFNTENFAQSLQPFVTTGPDGTRTLDPRGAAFAETALLSATRGNASEIVEAITLLEDLGVDTTNLQQEIRRRRPEFVFDFSGALGGG